MPPERNAPSGTSLSSRACTAARSVSSMSSSSSSSGRSSVSNSVTSQYCARLDAAVLHAQPVAGHELPDVAIDRVRRDEVAEREIALEAGEVELALSSPACAGAPAARWQTRTGRRRSCRRTASCRAGRARRRARAGARPRWRTRTCPRDDRGTPGPNSSYAWMMTSVSESVRKTCPLVLEPRAARRGGCRSRR